MIEFIKIILGLIFTLFLPGYLLSLLLFKKLRRIERISLSIGLSIAITVFLGFSLSAVSYLTFSKAITERSVWISFILLCVIFTIAKLFRR
jgi:uncharacterized membrane protein